MIDNFGTSYDTSMPATRSAPVVPGNDEFEVCRALLVGTAGSVVGQLRDDTADRTFKLTAGEHPLRFRIIRASSTAQDLVALY